LVMQLYKCRFLARDAAVFSARMKLINWRY
jgi:hypothetical protein